MKVLSDEDEDHEEDWRVMRSRRQERTRVTDRTKMGVNKHDKEARMKDTNNNQVEASQDNKHTEMGLF